MKTESVLSDHELKSNIREVELRRLEIGFQVAIDPIVIQNLRLGTIEDYALQHLIYEIRGHFWGEEPKRISFSFPADWKEAFKQRWFPEWALKKWPVRLTTKTLEGQLFYPSLPQTNPQHASRVRFAIFDGPGRYSTE